MKDILLNNRKSIKKRLLLVLLQKWMDASILTSLILPPNSIDADKKDISWVMAADARNDEECLIPANAVYHPYFTENGFSLFKSSTNGLASGNVIEEAVFHGITEVVERDAWSIYEAFRQPKIEVNCENSKIR